ncbi:MAG: copper amine oxidase N-terminal domain-containing protein [Armatimonadetes bacterium]|nr:copper amine oxidase N-terminal domain-containing protein [Armatimonadota bacterium]
MERASRVVMMGLLLIVVAATAWPADQLVSVYVAGKQVAMEPSARTRNGVTYGPLRGAAEAVGAHVEWNAASRTATICTATRCVPIKQSQGIMVGNSILIPVRLMSEALGRKVTWDAAAKAVRIQ